MPRVITVIQNEEHRGRGVENDPYRLVTCYYTLEGELLAQNDQWAIDQARAAKYAQDEQPGALPSNPEVR